mmetsp:Transcript_67500/g.159149  ORF Transcript_67500/g.159149 Transcript_67500/m.159149 type:complete len:146 (+) Transcript_67500:238-675(+)
MEGDDESVGSATARALEPSISLAAPTLPPSLPTASLAMSQQVGESGSSSLALTMLGDYSTVNRPPIARTRTRRPPKPRVASDAAPTDSLPSTTCDEASQQPHPRLSSDTSAVADSFANKSSASLGRSSKRTRRQADESPDFNDAN